MRLIDMQHLLDLGTGIRICDFQLQAVLLTSGVCLAPEYYRLVLVLGSSKDIVEFNSKSVEMSNVQWSKIMMERIV